MLTWSELKHSSISWVPCSYAFDHLRLAAIFLSTFNFWHAECTGKLEFNRRSMEKSYGDGHCWATWNVSISMCFLSLFICQCKWSWGWMDTSNCWAFPSSARAGGRCQKQPHESAAIAGPRTPAVLLLGVLKSVADVLRPSSSPHIWCSGVHGKRNVWQGVFPCNKHNFFPMQLDKIFYINLHESKIVWSI